MNPSMSNTTGQLPSEHQTPAGVEIQLIKTRKRSCIKPRKITEEMKALCLVPLQDGWKREIRARHTQDLRAADTYYYAPDGTRFRSRPEIKKYLEEKNITKYGMNNFLFYNKALGGECAHYEVVRMSQGPRPKTVDGQNDRTVSMTISPTEESEKEREPVAADSSKKGEPRNPLQPAQLHNPNAKLCCICTKIEMGQMVKCSNEGCAIKLYHLGCLVLSEVPKPSQIWYCPICQGSDPGTLNPAYAVQNGSS